MQSQDILSSLKCQCNHVSQYSIYTLLKMLNSYMHYTIVSIRGILITKLTEYCIIKLFLSLSRNKTLCKLSFVCVTRKFKFRLNLRKMCGAVSASCLIPVLSYAAYILVKLVIKKFQ